MIVSGRTNKESQRLRQDSAGDGKQYAVVRLEAWPLYPAAEDVELVAEDQDFDLLGFLGRQRKGSRRRRRVQ
jgi:hypothetical protein